MESSERDFDIPAILPAIAQDCNGLFKTSIAAACRETLGFLAFAKTLLDAIRNQYGGQRGIRTPGTLAGTPVFETGAFNHSAICPARMKAFCKRKGGRLASRLFTACNQRHRPKSCSDLANDGNTHIQPS